jgi:hypothetical protein
MKNLGRAIPIAQLDLRVRACAAALECMAFAARNAEVKPAGVQSAKRREDTACPARPSRVLRAQGGEVSETQRVRSDKRNATLERGLSLVSVSTATPKTTGTLLEQERSERTVGR